MSRLFSELLSALPAGAVVQVQGDVPVTAPVVEADFDVQPGGVFVARQGASVDGHDRIPQALERGAAAIIGAKPLHHLPVPYAQLADPQAAIGLLAAAYFGCPAREMVIAGVTGTDGKTTTSTLLHSILKAAGVRAGLISTLYADLGGAVADTGLHVTTPGAAQTQAYLAQMRDNGLTHAVIEMTSHGLAQGRLNGVAIDVALLTNITHEHLDYHGSFENYRAAKGRMFAMLGESYRKRSQRKIAIVNADDPNVDYFAAFAADAVWTYGLGEGAQFRAEAVQYLPDGIRFRVAGWPDLPEIHSPLLGRFNVMNCTAAVVAARAMSDAIAPQDYNTGIGQVTGIPGRMERIDAGQDFLAVVDFAHTPNALDNALRTGREMVAEQGGRVIAVFGSAGLRDREKRRLMADVSARLADVTILTAEDPRTESLDDILATMADACRAAGGVEGETVYRVPDRGAALYRACQMARAGDVVIACGKGHEQSMCFGAIEYPWDDREALRAALRGVPLTTLPTAQSG